MVTKSISLGKLTLIYTIGSFSSKIIRFVVFFFYTYFLTKGEIGHFDLINNTITLLIPIITFQVYDSILRWSLDSRSSKDLQVVLTNSLLIYLIGVLIFTLFYSIYVLITKPSFSLEIYLLVIFQSLYQILQQFARGKGENKIFAISGILYVIIFAIITVVGLSIYNLKLGGLIYANIGALIFTITYIQFKININKYISISLIDYELSKAMLKYSIPLIPNQLSWWLISAADRYLILLFLNMSANGLYSIAIKFPSILLMLHSIFNMAWQEVSIKKFNSIDRDKYYSDIFNKYSSIVLSLATIAIALSKPLINILLENSYYECWQLLPFLYTGVAFQALSSFYGSSYAGSKKTKGAFYTTIIGVIVSFISNLILIPKIGLIGCSISMMFGYISLFISRIMWTRSLVNIKIHKKQFLIQVIFIILVSMATISENKITLITNIISSLLISLYLNKGTLITLFYNKIQKASANKKEELTLNKIS
ncbi:lipopolysaccharide biosynthesis protein [Larkinella arboricola]